MSFDIDTERKKREKIEDLLADVLDNQLYSVPLNETPATFGSQGTRNSAHGDDGGNRSSLPTLHEISDLVNGIPTGIFDQLIPAAQTIILDTVGGVPGTISLKSIHQFIDGQILKITPAIGKTIDFLTGGNIALPNGAFSIGDDEMCELQYFANSNTYKCISTGSGSGTGASLPLDIEIENKLGLWTDPVTLNLSEKDGHVWVYDLNKDMTISSVTNLPAAGFQRSFEIEFANNDLINTYTVNLPSSFQNLTSFGVAPGQFAVLTCRVNDGANIVVINNSGIIAGGGGEFPTWTQDHDANGNDLLGVNNIDMDGISSTLEGLHNLQFAQTSQSINSLSPGLAYQVAALQKHEMIVGGFPVLKAEETTVGNYLTTLDSILNLVDNEINQVKHVAFSGTENLGSAESGIGMDNSGARMKYKTALTSQTHDFLAVNELLASISRVSSNSGQLNIDNVVAELLQTDQLFLSSATTPSPLLDGAIWQESGSGVLKARQNGITEDIIGGGGLTDLVSAIAAEPVTASNLTIFDDAGDMILNVPTGEKVRVREQNSTPSIISFGDSVIDIERRTNLNGNIVEGILRASFNSNATGLAANREIFGNADGLILNTPSTERIEMREAGVSFLELENDLIAPSVDNAVTLGDNSVGTPKRFAQVNAHGGDFAGLLLVDGNALFNSDVFLGNDPTDEIKMTGFVGTDIRVQQRQMIRSESGAEIGYLVTDDAGLPGSRGTNQMPTETVGIVNAADADAKAGSFLGATLYGELGSGLPILYIRQADGKWSSFAGTRDALV